MKYAYLAILTPREDGSIEVRVPDLSGLITFGDSIPDALDMARDAIEMWLT